MAPSVLFIGCIHIKANANKRKYKKKCVRRVAQQYKEELDQEVNENRILHGKKPFTPKMEKAEEYETKESTTDPESGYDEHYDRYLCETIKFSVIERPRETGTVNMSRILFCARHVLFSQCTQSRDHKKVIDRHLRQEAIDEVEYLRHTVANRALYRKRQETIECVFVDTKEKHGMLWSHCRGLKKRRSKRCLLLLY